MPMFVFITACRINDADNETIARMLKEKSIIIKYDDHKMLVEGFVTCNYGKTWSSYMATLKVDIYTKC